MTPKELSEIIEALILEAEEKFQAGTEAAQVNLWRTISGMLDGFDVDKAGNIKRTEKNLKQLRGLDRSIERAVTTPAYMARVSAIFTKFNKLGGIVDKYLKDEVGAAANLRLFDSIREESVERTLKSLTGAGIDANLTEPLKELLRTNIRMGGSFFDLRTKVKEFITGDAERLGRLRSYSGQITRDALNQFSANYTQAVSADLGLEWYYYSSGTVKDSRPFCVARAGRYFHKSEVESWASQKWAGKIAETTAATIFTYRGGWNCMHTLIPVSERRVPKDVLERVRGKVPEPVIEATKGTDGIAPDGFQFMPDLPKEVRDKLTFSGKHKNMPDNFGEWGGEYPDQFWDKLSGKPNLTLNKGGSYFAKDGKYGNVNLDKESGRADRSPGYKKRIVPHEFGHAWCAHNKYIAEVKIGRNYHSATNAEFVKLREEMLDFLRFKYKKVTDSDKVLHDFVALNKNPDPDVRENLCACADAICAITNNKAGFGHPTSYWRDPEMKYHELFAHLNENFWTGNPVFKELYPEIYEMGLKFMKNLYGF